MTQVYEAYFALGKLPLELFPNTSYWDKARIPQQDRLVLIPVPEASTRTAALLSGEVNWIEAPSPDAIPRLKSAGMRIVTNVYPHDWPHMLNFVRGPFKDLRIRQAANYAINRQDVVDLLDGTAIPEQDVVPPSLPYYGHPQSGILTQRALLKEAGCLPCKVTFVISTSGSGQMQPSQMNELVKSQLENAGFTVTLQTMDWNALLDVFAAGLTRTRITTASISRAGCSTRSTRSSNSSAAHIGRQQAPIGDIIKNPEAEALIGQIFNEFDAKKRLALLTQLHELESREAVMIFIVHDLTPCALSPKVRLDCWGAKVARIYSVRVVRAFLFMFFGAATALGWRQR